MTRGPKAARLHAIVTTFSHGKDDVCRCRLGRKIDEAVAEVKREVAERIIQRLHSEAWRSNLPGSIPIGDRAFSIDEASRICREEGGYD